VTQALSIAALTPCGSIATVFATAPNSEPFKINTARSHHTDAASTFAAPDSGAAALDFQQRWKQQPKRRNL
jgi:hypothetical protein